MASLNRELQNTAQVAHYPFKSSYMGTPVQLRSRLRILVLTPLMITSGSELLLDLDLLFDARAYGEIAYQT